MIKYYEYQNTYYKVDAAEGKLESVSVIPENIGISKIANPSVVSVILKAIEDEKWLEVGQIYYQQKRDEAYKLLET
jgi:hypothetical protein